ncbi:MAG: aconitase family protein, partial [Rhodothermales bacterium]|nr:aconitase family protein [Rhodothermales bacterium]
SLGYVVPGSLVVGSDSHSNMYGALGALGTPVVRTDAAAIWATGEFWWQIPPTIRVTLGGKLPSGVSGKDVIITLCGRYNQGEVLNTVVEFSGSGLAGLSIDERMTIANMTTEWGALAGWFPVDEVTIEYLTRREKVLRSRGIGRITAAELQRWKTNAPSPDSDAAYAGHIHLNLDEITPHVSGPDSVQVMTAVAEIHNDRVPVNKAYLVSCVNSRLSDLEEAARVLSGRHVADGVEFYVAAASSEIQEAAEASGVWKTLVDAGARTLPPGCGPCIGLGAGTLEPGEIGISATNRNFKGRMGSREAKAYLASPAVVAESAVAGYITGPHLSNGRRPEKTFEATPQPTVDEAVDIIEGFPATLTGRLVLVPRDNLNTDGIYPGDYTYREDMTREDMARVVMENYDPEFSGRVLPGDILVGGFNFGTGSSREQAATARHARGIVALIAGSFSQNYLRNAYNNGFICIACPELVEYLTSELAGTTPDELTIIPGDLLEIDFARGRVTLGDRSFRFAPLGSVP